MNFYPPCFTISLRRLSNTSVFTWTWSIFFNIMYFLSWGSINIVCIISLLAQKHPSLLINKRRYFEQTYTYNRIFSYPIPKASASGRLHSKHHAIVLSIELLSLLDLIMHLLWMKWLCMQLVRIVQIMAFERFFGRHEAQNDL